MAYVKDIWTEVQRSPTEQCDTHSDLHTTCIYGLKLSLKTVYNWKF